MTIFQPTMAAIDLGSNSFHLVVATIKAGSLEVLVQKSSCVQLAFNMHAGVVGPQALDAAKQCLADFQAIIGEHNADLVRVVGTAALRQAKNTQDIIAAIGRQLGKKVEIIDGTEEASLIYTAVAAQTIDITGRLVIDVGGGSTELAINDGNGLRVCSLPFGCVSVLQILMSGNEVSPASMAAAIDYCADIVRQYRPQLEPLVQHTAIGCSGSLQAIAAVAARFGAAKDTITGQSVADACDALLTDFRKVDDIKIAGSAEDRQKLFSSGMAIVLALLQSLPINGIKVSSAALREGLLLDYLSKQGQKPVKLYINN
ncbi:MAG: exopolyphosphatase/guanosine-5'-triphosphate,3'-diphosphate pyrophosphatase [Pseudomonadales bacterium]